MFKWHLEQLRCVRPHLFAVISYFQDDGFGNLCWCENTCELMHFLEDEDE